MRGYEGWALKDRSFLIAVGVSLLWHFFWFFSVTIVVAPMKMREKIKPYIVSLRPAFDDTIMKTLIDTRPEVTETFYRHLSDFQAPMEVQPQTIERYSAGDVVSIPFGRKVSSLLRSLVGGEKPTPNYEFASRLKMGYSGEVPGLEGEVKSRHVISRPPEPVLPPSLDTSLKNSETELRFIVTPQGVVSGVEMVASSGNLDIDLLWSQYLKEWRFSPLEGGKGAVDQKGKITFRFGARTKE